MKVEIQIDPAFSQQTVIIQTDRMTPEIEELAHRLEEDPLDSILENRIAAHSDRGVAFLPIDQIIRVYAQRQQVLAQTRDGVFTLRARLYEMEQRLTPFRFVRISNSEIVNARMITGMDFSLTGTICLFLQGGLKTYASRRYVAKILKIFDV